MDDNEKGTAGALLARKTWRTLEPLHGMVYFVPEAAEAYGRLGITGQAGYFASRSRIRKSGASFQGKASVI